MGSIGKYPRIGAGSTGGFGDQPTPKVIAHQISKIAKAALYLAVAHKTRSKSACAIEAPVTRPKPMVQMEHNHSLNPLEGPFHNPDFAEACRAIGCASLIQILHWSSLWSLKASNLLNHMAHSNQQQNQQKPMFFELGFYAPPGYAHFAKR